MFIQVDSVVKKFARRSGDTGQATHAALGGVSVAVEQGRMLALVGPSGSGKTTLLRCIAGLERPDAGSIRIGARQVFAADAGIEVPTEQRNLGLIFQSYALWPNMTVERNVAYPLKRRKVPEAECKARVLRYLDLVGCAHLAARFPHELSGGQQQRIALARALVYEPEVVLFDEPLSNLDPMLREHLRAQIREIQRTVGFTGVYVTHDQGEAFYVGDEVVILSEGRIAQAGSPDDIYRHPVSPHIAAFVGASNRVDGRLSDDGRQCIAAGLGTVTLAAPVAGAREVVLMARPEVVQLSPLSDGSASAASAATAATVIERVPSGGMDEYAVRLASGAVWRARVDMRSPRIAVGARVAVTPRADALFIYPREAAAELP